MAYLNTTYQLQSSFNSASSTINSSFLLRFGPREVSVCKDFRKRFYPTNPVIECRAGVNAGHVEVLLLRRWLVVFSKAEH
ncbi:hypothetical protein [Solimicrobium silvestre]|uniref:Uncharacterized protein n=1 Tax=Solimicrobium silvestre TaxID=2099400 RepID=A0A2S9H4Z4_9BURK|nr:hypothetical protein [Solimicrobium silvestre]PRC95038.1 hypothetical protein S2091_0233 [Solimicrobium silvestre]